MLAPTKFPAFKKEMLSMLDELQLVHDSLPTSKQPGEFHKVLQKYGCI